MGWCGDSWGLLGRPDRLPLFLTQPATPSPLEGAFSFVCGKTGLACWSGLCPLYVDMAAPTACAIRRCSPAGIDSAAVDFADKVRSYGSSPCSLALALALALAFEDFQRNFRALRSAPFRRPKVIGVSGVERHGCRESCDGPGTALHSGPLKLRRAEGIFREANNRMSGARPLHPLGGAAIRRLPKEVARGGETRSPNACRSDAEIPKQNRGQSRLLRYRERRS